MRLFQVGQAGFKGTGWRTIAMDLSAAMGLEVQAHCLNVCGVYRLFHGVPSSAGKDRPG